jgi:membrane protease YdiL (CAAX protease family)
VPPPGDRLAAKLRGFGPLGILAMVVYPGQGVFGAEPAAIVGLVLGTIFAASGRIWTVIFAHAAFDVTAVAIIYWNLESYVAHLVFK